jgi:hypothetical protein
MRGARRPGRTGDRPYRYVLYYFRAGRLDLASTKFAPTNV